MKEKEELLARVERFERTVATCLSIVPMLFSAQCLVTALGVPVFSAMFEDFGAKLPAVTHFVMSARPLWAAMAICVPITSVVVARKGKASFSVIFSSIMALVMFVVAQLITLALFLPVFQLGAVASGK
jgi:hypothetical protein